MAELRQEIRRRELLEGKFQEGGGGEGAEGGAEGAEGDAEAVLAGELEKEEDKVDEAEATGERAWGGSGVGCGRGRGRGKVGKWRLCTCAGWMGMSGWGRYVGCSCMCGAALCPGSGCS